MRPNGVYKLDFCYTNHVFKLFRLNQLLKVYIVLRVIAAKIEFVLFERDSKTM